MSKIIKNSICKFSLLYILMLLFAFQIPNPGAPYRIVFIHLGAHLPSFLHIALSQAHLFCPEAEIILIANQQATLNESLQKYVTLIHAEDIPKREEHERFIQTSRLDKRFREGFWYFATERLFYLDDLIYQYDLKNTFHLENDTLIYVDLKDLLSIFIENYPGIAAPFENDSRGFANFIFVPHQHCIHALACHLCQHADSGQSEMFLLHSFKQTYGHNFIDHLPAVMNEYIEDHLLITRMGGRCAIDPALFSKNIDQFLSVFDGCAYGQYFGGIDPRNGRDGPGYINADAFFNVSFMNLTWETDAQGRKVPYAIYRDKKYRINNLHIHSKNLKRFASKDFD